MIYLGTERIFANVWGKKKEKKSTKDYDEKLWKWEKRPFSENTDVQFTSQWETEH